VGGVATLLLALGAATWAATGIGGAASNNVVVSMTVPSATTLDASTCPSYDPARTSFGTLLPGAAAVTTADCNVLFGSTNDTATLRTYQSDATSSAMASDPTTRTEDLPYSRVLDLDMTDATTGWAVGDGVAANRLRRTVDGGATWNSVASPIGGSGKAVSAPNLNDVWAARYSNSQVIRSANGGSTWTSIPLPSPTAKTTSLSAIDGSNAWIVGSDGASNNIWRTIDGGANWTIACGGCSGSSSLTDIYVVPGTTTGWATDTLGTVWATTNGTDWSSQMTSGSSLQAVTAYDTQHVAAVGSSGQVFVSANGGATWANRSTSPGWTLRVASYLPSGVLWVAGEHGLVGRSANDGATWTVIGNRVEPTVTYDGEATSDTTFVASTSGDMFYRTADTGATWTPATVPTPGESWADITGSDGARMWRVGSRGRIDASTDGATWSAQTSGTSDALYAAAALTRQVVVAVGSNGTIVRTTDGGATWASVTSGTTATLRAISSNGDGIVWIVGDGGAMLRSSDAGATFTTFSSGTTRMLSAVASLGPNDVLVGDAVGFLRRSTDGGATWSTITMTGVSGGTPISALKVVAGTSTIWVTASQYLARSADAGTTWSVQSMGSGHFLDDVDVVDSMTAWASGRFGELERTTDGNLTKTTTSGTSGTRIMTSVYARGRDNAISGGEGGVIQTVDPGTGVPDYDGAAASWTGSGFFGVCLRAAPGAGSTWPTTGSCTQANGTNWRALPAHGGLAAASVASTLAPGTTTASFRFGMLVPANLPANSYRAPVTFEVTAPAG
jgi:photosystem II stability/assembly factor-like uncharacterized protein